MRSTASELIVHDDAIRRNAAYFSALTGGRLMAVLKADAFGHGDIARSVLEAGAGSIGVTCIDEALALRAGGVTAPILSWLNTPEADFDAALLARVDLAAPSVELLTAIGSAARRTGVTARVHLHLDVGINRDGCPAREWAALCALAREHEAAGALRVVGVMGHMSCADEPAHPQNVRERLVFANGLRTARRRGLTPSLAHLAATAATLNGAGGQSTGRIGPGLSEIHRIGAGLFGIDPSRTAGSRTGGSGTAGSRTAGSGALSPALTLTSTVVSVHEVSAGTGIGYGHDSVTPQRTRLALLPIGYGDGLPRAASGRAEVLVRGRRRPVVGRFSMDMIVVDTGDDLLHPGETVTVFGPGDAGEPTVADWADWAGTIEHEILTGIGPRKARIRRTLRSDPAPNGTDFDTDTAPTPRTAAHRTLGAPSCRTPRPDASPSSEAARTTSTPFPSLPLPQSLARFAS